MSCGQRHSGKDVRKGGEGQVRGGVWRQTSCRRNSNPSHEGNEGHTRRCSRRSCRRSWCRRSPMSTRRRNCWNSRLQKPHCSCGHSPSRRTHGCGCRFGRRCAVAAAGIHKRGKGQARWAGVETDQSASQLKLAVGASLCASPPRCQPLADESIIARWTSIA